MKTLINNRYSKTYCQKHGLFCEFANENGYCKTTTCSRLITNFVEDKQLSTNYRIVHRKDGIYDLFDSTSWIMSRGCYELSDIKLGSSVTCPDCYSICVHLGPEQNDVGEYQKIRNDELLNYCTTTSPENIPVSVTAKL